MRRATSWVTGVAVGAALLLGLVIVAGLQEAISVPRERRLTITLQDWPHGAPSLSIALLADIHLGNRAMDARRLTSIVGQVDAARPDMILIAGDFVVGNDAVGASELAGHLEGPLSELRAPLGVIAVFGNHDHWTAPAAIRAALTRAGATVLTKETMRRGPLAVMGIDDAFSGHDDIAAAISSWSKVGGVPLVLTHTPDLVHRLPRNLPVVMAGHTHCGQIVLPLIGPPLARSPKEHWRRLYDPRYRCGVIKYGGRTVVVTAGLGSGTTPIRIGAPPDWWLISVGPARK